MIRRILLLVAITLPITTYANIEITEIMYDLDGTDVKREWVEIYNSSGGDVDISDWRFYDGSNHVLNLPPINGGQGSLVLSVGEYAILTSDATTFLNEHNTGDTVIDTVMSLNNTEDTISIIDESGITIDEVTYTSEQGGAGNGNSLQLFLDGWSEGQPSLFDSDTVESETEQADNSAEAEPVDNSEAEDAQASSEAYTMPERIYVVDPYVKPQILADAGEDTKGVVSAMFFFEGHGYGLKGDLLINARYVWNFGDGNKKEGKNVAHTYQFPGTYRLSLTISSAEFSDTDRIIVEVTEADVEITYADMGRIEISNNSNSELDLSYWRIKYKDKFFTIPKGTFVLEKSRGIFPTSATNLVVQNLDELSLLYPNGIVASTFLVPVENLPIQKKVPVETLQKHVRSFVEEEIKEEKTKEENATSTQIASVAEVVLSKEGEGGEMYKWLLALISIVSVASLLALSKWRQDESDTPVAKDFKIIP